jgi:hypothetical protein
MATRVEWRQTDRAQRCRADASVLEKKPGGVQRNRKHTCCSSIITAFMWYGSIVLTVLWWSVLLAAENWGLCWSILFVCSHGPQLSVITA